MSSETWHKASVFFFFYLFGMTAYDPSFFLSYFPFFFSSYGFHVRVTASVCSLVPQE